MAGLPFPRIAPNIHRNASTRLKVLSHAEVLIWTGRGAQHGLVKCESDQARTEQEKTGQGHREETARREFFAHGAPPLVRSNRTVEFPAKFVGKRGGTRVVGRPYCGGFSSGHVSR